MRVCVPTRREAARLVLSVVVSALAAGMALACGGGRIEAIIPTDRPASAPAGDAAQADPGDRAENPEADAPRRNGRASPPTTRRATDDARRALWRNEDEAANQLDAGRRAFSKGRYTLAGRFVREARARSPLTPATRDRIESFASELATYRAAFLHTAPRSPNRALERFTYADGAVVEGLVVAEDPVGRRLTIARARGYQRLDLRDIVSRERVGDAEQRARQQRTYRRLAREFAARSVTTPLAQFRFARVAWQYGEPEAAHRWLAEALARDPTIAATAKLEADPAFARYRAAFTRGDLEAAGAALVVCLRRYPQAALFREAAARLARERPATAGDGPPRPPGSAGNAAAAPPGQASAEAQLLAGSVLDEDLRAAKEAASTLRAERRVPETFAGSPATLERRGDDYAARGDEAMARATPGADDAEVALEQAVYAYRVAQECYRRARAQGPNGEALEDKLVRVNRALFWAAKRLPIR